MAFDAKDIAAAKRRIPDKFRPAPDAGGRLSNDFSSVDSLRESTPLQGSDVAQAAERERFNLGLAIADNPDHAGASFILSGSQAARRERHMARQEREKREAERRYVIASLIDQIEARNRQIAENLERLTELAKQETALQRQIDRLRRGEEPARNPDGSLRDEDAEAAVREYEDRYGVTVDRSDADQVTLVLQGVRDEQLRIRRENEDLAADNERDREMALDMGANPDSIPATVSTLEQTVAGQRSVATATARMTNQSDRLRVAEAITHDENDEALAKDAATSSEDLLMVDETVTTNAGDTAKLKLPTPG